MRASYIAVVVLGLALVGGVLWWATRPAGSASGTAIGGPDVDDVDDQEAVGAPQLRGRSAPEGAAAAETRRARVPTVVGTVRQAGLPIAATVEVYLLGTTAPETPVAWGDTGGWIRRMDPVPPSAPVATTRSGSDGKFRIENLPRGAYQMAAIADDGARGTHGLEIEGVGIFPQDIDVAFGSHVLKGVVRDATGAPWRGGVRAIRVADERTFDQARPGDEPPVPTDAAGRFAIPRLDAGRYYVHAEIPGTVRVEGPEVWVPAEKDCELTVGKGMHPLPGHVLNDEGGAPIEGAIVVGYASNTWTRATTGADGSFTLLASDTEPTWYSARAPSFDLGANYAPIVAKHLPILLTRPGRITGRVTERTGGAAVSGVTVLAVRRGGGSAESMGWSAVTGPDGRYALEGVATSEILVTVRDGGFVLSEGATARRGAATLVAVRRGEATVADLVVDRGLSLPGRVVDPEGKGVAGARIQVVIAKYGNDPGFTVPVTALASDPDGKFQVPGLSPGNTHHLTAVAPGFYTATQEFVPSAEAPTPLEITFARPNSVDVRVVDEAGRGIDVAEVTCDTEYGAPGPDGLVHLHWVSKWSNIVVRAPGTRDFETTLGSPDASGSYPVVVATMIVAKPIGGRVTYSDGSPAAGVAVWTDGTEGSVNAAADGTFALGAFPVGERTVFARDPDHDAEVALDDDVRDGSVAVAAKAGDERVLIVLPWKGPPPPAPPEPKLVVRVLDPSGVVVPLATIHYKTAADSGTASVEGGVGEVPRSITSLTVSRAFSSSGSPLPLGPGSHGPAPAGASEIEVRLTGEHRVAGVVLDPSGRPVANAHVSASTEGANDKGGGRTDERGRFSIGGLGAGPATLSVAATPGFLALGGVVAAEGATDVTLSLRAAARVVATVTDPEGAPVAGAQVVVYTNQATAGEEQKPGGLAYVGSFETDATGKAVIEGIDPAARLDFKVTPNQAKRFLATQVHGAAPSDLTIPLPRANAISGRVRDPAGLPISGALVRCEPKPPDGNHWAARTEGDGTFELIGVGTGMHALDAQLGDDTFIPGLRTRASADAAAGATGVELTLDRGLAVVVRLEGAPRNGEGVEVRLYAAKGDENGVSKTADADGLARFEHARPDARFTVAVGPLPGRLVALVNDVRPGERPTVARLVRGESIRGRLVGVPGAAETGVTAEREGVLWSARVDGTGAFLFPALPPGTYRLLAAGWRKLGPAAATGEGDDAWAPFSGSAEASAGATGVELRVEDVKEPKGAKDAEGDDFDPTGPK